MADQSYLDLKYFVQYDTYNCPFCNRKNVKFSNLGNIIFDWSNSKICTAWFVRCSSCNKRSMHLTYDDLQDEVYQKARFSPNIDIDSKIFYSVPTSFFVLDSRIPEIFRELITEAEGCVKMNFLTGASACTRKAIYELTIKEKAEGNDYEDRIKYLKKKYHNISSELFDILCHIKDMTSDKIHEQSWDKWNSKYLKLFIETLKTVLYEIYVLPPERKSRVASIEKLLKDIRRKSSNISVQSKDKA